MAAENDPEQTRCPFLESLLREQATPRISFHMPGHKFNPDLIPALRAYWGGDVYSADLVEIGGHVDYLHAPKNALLEAQQLAAQAYGADQTFFLINGSTVGNLAAIMAATRDGQKLIMPRASHRSVYGGLVLSGAVPVYIPSAHHPQGGFALPPALDDVRTLLQKHPDAAAVQLTAPNYYGFVCDVGGTAALAQQAHLPLLVDEAHGAHFAFHPALPKSAVHLGADIVVQSLHKTAGALTQAAVLHCKHGLINITHLAQILTLLQSSSPSALLTASLDAARQQMAAQGRALLEQVLTLAYTLRAEIRAIDGLWVYGEELVQAHDIFAFDPTKLVIRVSHLGLSGTEAAHWLRAQHWIEVEFADPQNIVCSLTIADTPARAQKLLEALRALAAAHTSQSENQTSEKINTPPLPEMALPPRQAYFAPAKQIRLSEAAGAVCAENIIPYPPGIPLLVPGEIITQEMIDYIGYVTAKGVSLVGPEDLTGTFVRVL